MVLVSKSSPLGRTGFPLYLSAHPDAVILLRFIDAVFPDTEWTYNALVHSSGYPGLTNGSQLVTALVSRGALKKTGKVYLPYPDCNVRNTYQITQMGKSAAKQYQKPKTESIELIDIEKYRQLTSGQIAEITAIAEKLYLKHGYVRPVDIAYEIGCKRHMQGDGNRTRPYHWISQALVFNGYHRIKNNKLHHGQSMFIPNIEVV